MNSSPNERLFGLQTIRFNPSEQEQRDLSVDQFVRSLTTYESYMCMMRTDLLQIHWVYIHRFKDTHSKKKTLNIFCRNLSCGCTSPLAAIIILFSFCKLLFKFEFRTWANGLRNSFNFCSAGHAAVEVGARNNSAWKSSVASRFVFAQISQWQSIASYRQWLKSVSLPL